MNIAHALDFPSGKLWVAEQLDRVATRYLNRSARIVAQHVRGAMMSGDSSCHVVPQLRSDQQGHERLVVPELPLSSHSSTDDFSQSYIPEQ